MAFRIDSTFSQYWDLAQVALLFYISITVPIRAGFEVTVPAWWAKHGLFEPFI
jgi:hypothetical protein